MTASVLPRPEVLPPRPWTFPSSTSFTLANGLTVVVHDLPGKHLLAMRLVLDLPTGADPKGSEGAAVLAVRALAEGTESYDSQGFATARDRLGASYGAGCDGQAATISMEVPVSRLAPALELLAEATIRPTFPEAEVQRLVRERLDAVNNELASPNSRASIALSAAYYTPGSRRAVPTGGTAESVATLTPELIARLFRSRVVPATTTLVIAGAVGDVDLKGLVENAFGRWDATAPATELTAPDDIVGGPQVVIVDRPGSVQTMLALALPAVARGHVDAPALELAGYVLGGGMESRIMTVLREEKGYTYGISAGLAAERFDGRLFAMGSVQTDVTGPAVSDLVTILRTFAAEGIREQERVPAVDQLAGRAPLQYETAAAVATTSASLVAGGLPADHVDRRRAALQQTTVESVNTAFTTHCPVDRMVLIAVGDASLIEAPLRALDLGEFTVLPA